MKYIGKKRTLINGRYEIEDIAKCKTNIVELLEKGDYVNGFPIQRIEIFKDGTWAISIPEHIKYFSLHAIDSIVTHEQFEAMKYIVKEKKYGTKIKYRNKKER